MTQLNDRKRSRQEHWRQWEGRMDAVSGTSGKAKGRGKSKHNGKGHDARPESSGHDPAQEPGTGKMSRKAYEKALARLQGDLVQLQLWVKATGAKVCIVFEGRDGAGKGGTIKAITERVSPRVFRVVALPAPTRAREEPDVCPALHAALPRGRRGRDLRPQLVQPRRRRARHGLLHATSRRSASSSMAPAVEKAMVDSGIILLKYWLEVSRGGADAAARGADRRSAARSGSSRRWT